MSQEKTEQPTDHKLRKAREDGDAPQTKDFVSTAVSALGLSVLLGLAGVLGAQIIGLVRRSAQGGFDAAAFETILARGAQDALTVFLTVIAPFAAAAIMIAPLATAVGQGGLTLAKYKLKFEAFSPAKNFQQRFSKQALIEFLKAVLRFAIIIAVFVFVVLEAAPVLMLSVFCGLDCASEVARDVGVFYVAIVFAIMVALALMDILLQRALWRQKQKMTPEEVKREHKELEGDPLMKRERKSLAQRLVSVTPDEAIDYASVVFVDNAGRAVAVYCSDDPADPAVTVLLGGAGAAAQRLVTRAEAEGVPVVPDARLTAATIGLSGMTAVEDPRLKAAIFERIVDAGVAGEL